MENKLFVQFVLLSGSKIYFFWQKYTSQTKYFFGSLSNRSPCIINISGLFFLSLNCAFYLQLAHAFYWIGEEALPSQLGKRESKSREVFPFQLTPLMFTLKILKKGSTLLMLNLFVGCNIIHVFFCLMPNLGPIIIHLVISFMICKYIMQFSVCYFC